MLHCRLRDFTPPPHVLEQEPNLDQDPQLPSWPCGSSLVLQIQWPLKHHCVQQWQKKAVGKRDRNRRKRKVRHRMWTDRLQFSQITLQLSHKGIIQSKSSHLSRGTLRTVHRRTFFSFAEVLVVRVAAPKLLARVIGTKLEVKKKGSCIISVFHVWKYVESYRHNTKE